MRVLRILFLADSLVVGGAERVVEALCVDLPAHSFAVRVGCLRAPGPIGQMLRAAGTALDEQLAPSRVDPSAVLRLRHYVRRAAPDVLYTLDHSNVLFYGRLAGRLAGVPAQVTAVHRTGRADGRPSLGAMDRMLMGLTDRVIAVSRDHADYLAASAKIPRRKLAVIYNGVDPQRFGPPLEGPAKAQQRRSLGLPEHGALVGIVAALRPEKNHELLLQALTRLPDGPALAVVGEGPLRAQLHERVTALGLSRRVVFLGRRDDVPQVLSCLDALALSSHPVVETFPMCVLEGMAAQLPIVATQVGSLGEMLGGSSCGILVPPGDPDILARALSQVAADPQQARAMGRAGRRRVCEHFTRSRMVEETAALLRQLAETAGGTHE